MDNTKKQDRKKYNKETLSLLDTKLAELFLRALWLQCTISAVLIFTGAFEQILIYCGVLLNITSMFVVAGVFILRAPTTNEKGHNYRSPLFPLFQLFSLLVSLWMIAFAFIAHPFETMAGMSNLAIDIITFYWRNIVSIQIKG